MKKFLFLLILLTPFVVSAEEDTLNSKCTIKVGETIQNIINDGNYRTYNDYDKDTQIDITCESDISYVYIYYNVDPTSGKINNSQELKGRYLHELTKLDSKSKTLSLTFDDDYSIADIYLLEDTIPSWVESWSVLSKADMLLFSTHADDEQLFFAGLMPTYINTNKKIQVVYFTNHYNDTNRYHELLEGLWAIGVTYYPEVSTFPDAYSESLEGAIANLNNAGYTEADALEFMTRMIRKYRPSVVVGHDENGEYSHGQHILNTHILKDAYIKAADNNYDSESIQRYGTHQIDKLYLHLYKENPIVLDYDVPLEKYNGKTAYEVSKEGFAKHISQQNTWFTDWLNGPNKEFTKATQIDSYVPASLTIQGPFTPCNFGLYFSNVGEDIKKNDMFENIKEETPVAQEKSKEEESSGEETKTKFKIDFHNKNVIIGGTLAGISIIGMIIILFKGRK